MLPQLVLYEEDQNRLLEVTDRLVEDANAKAVFLVDKNGQLVGESGELTGIDTVSLASLVAGNVAATCGLAKIIGEPEFPIHFHQGERDNMHMTTVAQRVILVVIFDDRSSLGLVRLRVRRAGQKLSQIFDEVFKRAEAEFADDGPASPLTEISDDDIDNLFSD
ncbi:MAG: roadblock/LC7 domain-containing protein [bacterium]|nr:roadblock/LC7 domain-containing protein [bacterium]